MASSRQAYIISLFILAFGTTSALKCKFSTFHLNLAGDHEESQKPDEKEYECPKGDKYCMVLGGVLTTPPKNVSFALRSCESQVKQYMDPISQKIGQKLDYACEHADGKNHTVGPLTYWWNCCTSNDCNSGAMVHYNAVALMALVSACLLFSSMLIAY